MTFKTQLRLVWAGLALCVSAARAEEMDQSMHMGGMTGALGNYPMEREASGTSWQPDSGQHGGLHVMTDDWMLMAHGTLNAVYDWQSGARGDSRAFVSGMFMGAAQRGLGNGDTVNFRAMLSPDPVMGKRGYPLLFASGETADGKVPLVDRQHPHDLFMELSASYSHPFAAETSAFVYVGLPGEPAFGPPAFMHRASVVDSPEAPISHHWLDSTHITYGVATGGMVFRNWKAEVSRFTGREPDETRTDIDHPRFDSTSARVSWNPGEEWALQASWAHLHSPEQLHPSENETRWSASAIYTHNFGDDGTWSATAAWGRKQAGGETLDAWALEAAVTPVALWTVFARAERVEEAELQLPAGSSGPAVPVTKISAGAVHDFVVSAHAAIGLGALYAFNWPGAALRASYGGNKSGAMVFTRLTLR